MAADCEWQNDTWRKNSTENRSFPQSPPPIPAPPQDPQENLANRVRKC